MKAKDLYDITMVAFNQVGMYGKDAAKVYRAIVELDRQVALWKARAKELGWNDEQEE